MTVITGNVQDIGYQPLSGTITATSVDFRSEGGALVAPESRQWNIVAGAVSATLLPGPARLTIQVGSHARDEWDVIVPDTDVELATLIEDSIEWAPPIVSIVGEHRRAAEEAAGRSEQAAQDADAAIADAAAQVVSRVEGDRARAEQAATDAVAAKGDAALSETAVLAAEARVVVEHGHVHASAEHVDTVAAYVAELLERAASAPGGGGGLSLDVDGVPYFTPGGALQLDVDGAPYF